MTVTLLLRPLIASRVQTLVSIALAVIAVVLAIWIARELRRRAKSPTVVASESPPDAMPLSYGCTHCSAAARSVGLRKGVLFMLDRRGGSSELYECMRCGALWEGSNNAFDPIATADAEERYPAARAVLQGTTSPMKVAARRVAIDTTSGAVITARGRIEPIITKSQFLASQLFDRGAWTNETDGWYQASTRPVTIAGEEFDCDLMFHFEELHHVRLMSSDPAFGTGWDDHSWANETARHERHEQWLSANVGLERKYAWGDIWCGIDYKGGFASIGVHYNHWRVGSANS